MDPVDIHRDELRRFDINTRFRDLHRLHQQLSTIHRQVSSFLLRYFVGSSVVPERHVSALRRNETLRFDVDGHDRRAKAGNRRIPQFCASKRRPLQGARLPGVHRREFPALHRFRSICFQSSREKSPEPPASEPVAAAAEEPKNSSVALQMDDELD